MDKFAFDADSRFPWHEDAWRRLIGYIGHGRIPHALLIAGKKGVGKKLLAHRFAKTLLCPRGVIDGEACGKCHSCTLFKAGTHPDFLPTEPEENEKEIIVGAIRELAASLALSTQYGGYRIVLIAPAHRMNTSAANCLLKTLEEPVEKTLIFLLSDEPYALLPTIRSRCQRIDLALPERSTALRWLVESFSCERPQALLAAAQGAPLLALEMADSNALASRELLLNTWLSVPPCSDNLIVAVEKWVELPAGQILFWLTSWVIDMIRLKYTEETEALFNPDLGERLQAVARGLNLQQLFGGLDLLLATRPLLKSQVNKQLMFEDTLIKWAELRKATA